MTGIRKGIKQEIRRCMCKHTTEYVKEDRKEGREENRKAQKNKKHMKREKYEVKHEAGYTLLYTLMIMALMLSLSAYLFTKVDVYRSLVESKKYTANTYLAAETLVISEGERIAGRFNQLNGNRVMKEQEDFEILSSWNLANCYLYYTAKTYLTVTQSLFQEPIVNYYLTRDNQVRPKYIMQVDRQRPEYTFEVESRVNPYNVYNVSNPLKKELTHLETVDKAVKEIQKALQDIKSQKIVTKQAASLQEKVILDQFIPQFDSLEVELLSKPLYEVESIAKVVNQEKTLSSQTLYLTLYLEAQEKSVPHQIEGQVYSFTLPYELKTGYLKAKKNSN